jgi:hypothetical protein
VHRAIKSYLRSVHTHPRMYKHGHILVLKTFISKTLSTIFQKYHSCVSTCWERIFPWLLWNTELNMKCWKFSFQHTVYTIKFIIAKILQHFCII